MLEFQLKSTQQVGKWNKYYGKSARKYISLQRRLIAMVQKYFIKGTSFAFNSNLIYLSLLIVTLKWNSPLLLPTKWLKLPPSNGDCGLRR